MRLGLDLGHWSGRPEPLAGTRLAQEAERLGYDVVWASEAFGSDAVSVLATVAARTRRVDVGSAVLQIPARSAAMTAMTAATLDTLSAGRFRLGLGVSGPQVSEGWHGVRFGDPLGRTAEYLEVVRAVLAREEVHHEGRHLQLPLPGGPGKALRLAFTPLRPRVPVYLASLGPRNLELTGELADGWLGVFVAAEQLPATLASLDAGRRRAPDPQAPLDVVASVPAVVETDLERAADALRPRTALYVGGMGSRELNVYTTQAARLGYEQEAAHVQDLYLARDHRAAAAAVPTGLVDATSLLGPRERLRDRLAAYADAGVTTLSVAPVSPAGGEAGQVHVLRTVAEALEASGRAS